MLFLPSKQIACKENENDHDKRCFFFNHDLILTYFWFSTLSVPRILYNMQVLTLKERKPMVHSCVIGVFMSKPILVPF